LHVTRARRLRALTGHLLLMHLLDQLTLVHVLRVLLGESRALMMVLILMEQLLRALEILTPRRQRVAHLMLLHGQTVRLLRPLTLERSVFVNGNR